MNSSCFYKAKKHYALFFTTCIVLVFIIKIYAIHFFTAFFSIFFYFFILKAQYIFNTTVYFQIIKNGLFSNIQLIKVNFIFIFIFNLAHSSLFLLNLLVFQEFLKNDDIEIYYHYFFCPK